MRPSVHSSHILKFGGTSVGSGERIRRVAAIIAHYLQDTTISFPVVVVSAMSGMTDRLLRIAHAASTDEQEICLQELAILKQKHLEAAEQVVFKHELKQALLHDLHEAFCTLEQDIASVTQHLLIANQQIDENNTTLSALHSVSTIAAWGERLSVLLTTAALHEIGIQATSIREEVIITTDLSSDRPPALGTVIGADPLVEETRVNAQRLIHPLLEHGNVPIIPGFIGRTRQGYITTLGRNGSDYSATVIGAALDCVEVSIYTDVDGILSADPRIVPNARLLPQVSYAEAARLSWFGAKVLHPRTLIPVAHRNIPVRVRNTFRPYTRGTLVGPEQSTRSGAAAISVRHQLALITVENTDLFGAPENAGQVFALAARAGATPVTICSSSGHHLSFVVEEQAAHSVVDLLQHDMGNWRVSCRRGLAACACIGSGFIGDPMSSARAITALARERIPVITQGASDTAIILIVEEADSEHALRCLHRDLIAPVIPLLRHERQTTKDQSDFCDVVTRS